VNILAIDPSLTGTGICLYDGSTHTIHTKLRGPERLQWIRDAIIDRTLAIRLVVIEGYSYGSKGAAVVNIGELGGVLRLAIYERQIPLVEIPPSCLKKYATGKGNASKDDVLQAGVMRSGHTFADNNACDAWWLHQLALAHYEPDNPLLIKMPAGNREGLKKEWVAVQAGGGAGCCEDPGD